MERLVLLRNEENGEGVLIDDDRHLVSQILVPNRHTFDHIDDITEVDSPTDVYSTQVNLIANKHYWMWPVRGEKLTFPTEAINHQP
jgi:hypothetical protein